MAMPALPQCSSAPGFGSHSDGTPAQLHIQPPSSRAGTPVPSRLPCFTPAHPHVPPFQNHPGLVHGEGGSHSGR